MRKTYLFLLFISIACSSPQQKIEQVFVKVEGGIYQLGYQNHPLNPIRAVEIQTFYIANTEVTNAQFAAFVEATGYVTDAEKYQNARIFYVGLDEYEWKDDTTANWKYPNGKAQGGIENKMNHPVTTITFQDALAYCEWAEVRLPTFEEWEVACRGGSNTIFIWGDKANQVEEYANIWLSPSHQKVEQEDEYLTTSPIGSFKPNDFGLYDMYGNVFEFCQDCPEVLSQYEGQACARGGSWWCSKMSCNYFNSVDIGFVRKFVPFSNQGFRVVKDK